MKNTRTRYVVSLSVMAALVAIMSGCSYDSVKEYEWEQNWNADRQPDKSLLKMALQSTSGCAIDTDCATGSFCYHGQCTMQCSDTWPCEDSEVCTLHGRCISKSASAAIAASARHRDADSDSEFDEAMAEKEASDVVEMIENPDIISVSNENVFVGEGEKSVQVKIRTAVDYGAINYIVRDTVNDKVSMLQKATIKTDVNTGTQTYTFELPTSTSAAGDEGAAESLQLDSAFGKYGFTLRPARPASGMYDATISTDKFSGESLPLRIAIKTTPVAPKSFDDIKAIQLYVAASETDIFSPISVEPNDDVKWVSVNMKKGEDCIDDSADNCWVAQYSTQNFTNPSLTLVSAEDKVTRSLRIEFYDHDSDDHTFYGKMTDTLSGFYRNSKADQNSWNSTMLTGNLVAIRTNKLDESKMTIVEHTPASGSDYRDINTAPKASDELCNAGLAKLKTYAVIIDEANNSECDSVDKFRSNEKCLSDAVYGILSDKDTLISSRIAKILGESSGADAGDKETFSEFITDCVSGKDGSVCADRPEVLCAVGLVGEAFMKTTDAAASKDLIEKWHSLVRESYLGLQFSAWQNDVQTREDLFKSINAPQFISSMVASAINDKLDKWEETVLSAHQSVLKRQFSQLSLEVLMRAMNDENLRSTCDLVLSEYADAWSSLSNTLAIGLSRYNTILTTETSANNLPGRAEKADELRHYLFDLYFSGVVETGLNLNSSNSSLNAGYGSNFTRVINELNTLDQSFDELVYMRDAEVAVPRSLTGDTTTADFINERQNIASGAVEQAIQKYEATLDVHNASEINKEQITAVLTDNIDKLQTEIVSICGYPDNKGKTCLKADDGQCKPMTDPGFCGFKLPHDAKSPGDLDRDLQNGGANIKVTSVGQTEDGYDLISAVGTGSAAEAVSKYREAVANVKLAQAELDAAQNKFDTMWAEAEGYAAKLETWHQKRLDLSKSIMQALDGVWGECVMAEVVDGKLTIPAAYQGKAKYSIDENGFVLDETGKLVGCQNLGDEAEALELEEIRLTLENHEKNVKNQKDALNTWDSLASKNLDKQVATKDAAAALESVSMGLEYALDITDIASDAAEAWSDGDTLSGFFNPTKGATAGTFAITKTAFRTGQFAVDVSKMAIEAAAEVADLKFNYETELNAKQAEVDAAELELELEKKLNALAEKNRTIEGRMEELNKAAEKAKELFNVEDQYARDLAVLDEKRAKALVLYEDIVPRYQEVSKAIIARETARTHYYSEVQRAQALQAQYDAATARLKGIVDLYMSPASIFAYASDLELVESEIDYAKEKIYDYLAAVEYYAVRPFIDVRRTVYMSRSPNDLKKVLSRIDEAKSTCGGTTNTAKAEVSMREQLGVLTDVGSQTKGERFNNIIRQGTIPVNAMTRYTVDSNVRDLLKSKDYRSGTFAVEVANFANLSGTCNGKIDGFAFKLVGENLIKEGAGENVHPSITLFYNGQTQLTSCQPNMDQIMSQVDPSKTRYGKISTFTTPDKKITVNAGLNDYAEKNQSLKGLPLVTSYTIFIDPSSGENDKINWDNLEDVMIQFNYTYEDLYDSTSSCTSNAL